MSLPAVCLRTEKKLLQLELSMTEVAEIARVDPIVPLDAAAVIANVTEALDESAKEKNIASIVRGAQTLDSRAVIGKNEGQGDLDESRAVVTASRWDLHLLAGI